MLEADILERTIGASVSWRRSGPRLWRPRRRPTGAGPKVPMTRRRGAGVRDRGPPGGRLRAHLQRAGGAIQNNSGLPQGQADPSAVGCRCGRLTAALTAHRGESPHA
jgi:hypothetical protein